VISLDRLVRVFQVGDHEVRALAGVSFEIADGEHLAIMGPSGSGKSTLLHILGLLDRPTSGRYRLDGRDVTDLNDDEQARVRREKIGFVFQFFHLVPYLTAAENVELPMMLAGVTPSERRPRVATALEGLGLGDRMEHRPDQLSGGQRQRVAIARATVMGPNVLLADEPTGNLDRRSGEDVMRILEALNRDGLTLIVVTHDPDVAARARRRVRMLDGVVVEDVRA
jgi:putative ABC transport system ATP-binding protein